jgi:hypothetical protein
MQPPTVVEVLATMGRSSKANADWLNRASMRKIKIYATRVARRPGV